MCILDVQIVDFQACAALIRLSRRALEPPFFSLVDALESDTAGSIVVKSKILTFVNVLVQCTPELELRHQIRSCFIAFDFATVCDDVIAAERKALPPVFTIAEEDDEHAGEEVHALG